VSLRIPSQPVIMFTPILISVILSSAFGQGPFVFFGGNQGNNQQRFDASRPSPREGRLLVEPSRQEFANTLFRPSKKIEKPSKKDALPAKEEHEEELVQILTEVPKTAIAPGSDSEQLVNFQAAPVTDAPIVVVPTAAPIVVVPTAAPVVVVPTAAPVVVVPTAAPIVIAPTAQPRPVPAAPSVVVINNLSSRPATRTLGQSVVRQIGGRSSTRTQPSPIVVSRPTPRPSAPQPSVAQPLRPVTPRTPKALASPKPKGNYEYDGNRYLLTWRTGHNNFDWSGGVRHCQSKGMKLISLDSKEKSEHFLNLVKTDRAPYFWSGGQVSRDSRTLTWQNGEEESIRRGQHPWSFTGRTGPQPDGGETCLAVLNSVYRDGVKYHDVACHHRKPVVCEE